MTWGKGIVVVSGGVDSIVLLHWLANLGCAGAAVFFDYGQLAARVCGELAASHAQQAGVPLEVVRLPMPTRHGGVYQHGFAPTQPDDADGDVDVEDLAQWRREQWSWIEARNALFVTWAAGRAADLDLRRVFVGFQEESHESAINDEVDVTRPFVDAVNAMLTFGSVSRPVTVVAPWLDLGLDKAAIVKLGRQLGVDVAASYSCEFYPPCGTCGACARRARALG